MHILPVIDLMNGQVVRGIAGRRAEYKPIVSRLTNSTDPMDVALAFREHFGFEELYIADLDAIAGQAPAWTIIDGLHSRGFHLWIDAGIKHAADAVPILAHDVASMIAGLETLAGPEALTELVTVALPARLVFSLDLKGGQPLTSSDGWSASDPFVIAEHAYQRGIRRILILDLAQVGVGAGLGTEALCRRLRARFPDLQIAAGGGVRGLEDVTAMHNAGVDWLLVASALHDGRLRSDEIGMVS